MFRFYHLEMGIMEHTFIVTMSAGNPVLVYWQGPAPVFKMLALVPSKVSFFSLKCRSADHLLFCLLGSWVPVSSGVLYPA